jgi:hypothetical protein
MSLSVQSRISVNAYVILCGTITAASSGTTNGTARRLPVSKTRVFSLFRPGFDLRVAHVGFVMDKLPLS